MKRPHLPADKDRGITGAKKFTPRDLRNAVILAVVITATVVFALFDPSCQRFDPSPSPGPSRSVVPH